MFLEKIFARVFRRGRFWGPLILGFSVVLGCGDDSGVGKKDADITEDAAFDANWADAFFDAHVFDGGEDANLSDGSGKDSGCIEVEASVIDAAVVDAWMDDAAFSDGGTTDAGKVDGGGSDGGGGDGGVVSCGSDMVLVEGLFCIDKYEASRPDATLTSKGTLNATAMSRPNVRPWYTCPWEDADHITLQEARAACEMAGKRLCYPWEWEMACRGSQSWSYGYGNDYDPVICNGIDTYCKCNTTCAGVNPCPYAHCFNQPPEGETIPASGCGAYWRIDATGVFTLCKSDYEAFDLNGNVWEMVDTTDGQTHFRGGACNCIDSEYLHDCGFDRVSTTTNPNVRGFRCCKDQ